MFSIKTVLSMAVVAAIYLAVIAVGIQTQNKSYYFSTQVFVATYITSGVLAWLAQDKKKRAFFATYAAIGLYSARELNLQFIGTAMLEIYDDAETLIVWLFPGLPDAGFMTWDLLLCFSNLLAIIFGAIARWLVPSGAQNS